MFILIPIAQYIKKEDVPSLLKTQQHLKLFFLLVSASMLGIAQWYFYPRVVSLFSEFGTPLPFETRVAPLVNSGAIVLLLGSIIYFLNHKQDTTANAARLKKYKKGEMIRITELIDMKDRLLWMLPIILSISWMVFSVFFPLYSLRAY